MNEIHESVILDKRVHIGVGNVIRQGVEFIIAEDFSGIISIGDNNIFNENIRIIISKDFIVGDWNVFHRNMLIMSIDKTSIGHNCWFGQNTILDGQGKLTIGNGVRIGMYSQIWTHVSSGERIEGCTLYGIRETIIEDDVWLVGSCIVGSGLLLRKKSIFMIGSLVTKDSIEKGVYMGQPAKIKEGLSFYKDVNIEEKFELIYNWLNDFVLDNENIFLFKEKTSIKLKLNNETISFYKEKDKLENGEFCLTKKEYRKSNSYLERLVYKILYGNKARFLPIN